MGFSPVSQAPRNWLLVSPPVDAAWLDGLRKADHDFALRKAAENFFWPRYGAARQVT